MIKKFLIIFSLHIAIFAYIFNGSLSAVQIGEYTDPNKIIRSNPDKIVVILLESNPTTGYKWKLDEASPAGIISFMNSEYMTKSPGLTGSGGTEIWSFRALAPGDVKLRFNYIRPWESNEAPAKTIEFTVSVDEPEYEKEPLG